MVLPREGPIAPQTALPQAALADVDMGDLPAPDAAPPAAALALEAAAPEGLAPGAAAGHGDSGAAGSGSVVEVDLGQPVRGPLLGPQVPLAPPPPPPLAPAGPPAVEVDIAQSVSAKASGSAGPANVQLDVAEPVPRRVQGAEVPPHGMIGQAKCRVEPHPGGGVGLRILTCPHHPNTPCNKYKPLTMDIATLGPRAAWHTLALWVMKGDPDEPWEIHAACNPSVAEVIQARRDGLL